MYSCTHFVTSALGGDEWSTSLPDRSVREKELRCQLNWKLGGRFGEEKYFYLPGIEPRIVQPGS
jgi:hypothetical protein